MIIGTFEKSGDSYAGTLVTLNGVLNDVVFRACKREGTGPDYTVSTYGCELGAAWTKTSKKGNSYLSVKLDSPFLPMPINCAMMASDQGAYLLRWNRED